MAYSRSWGHMKPLNVLNFFCLNILEFHAIFLSVVDKMTVVFFRMWAVFFLYLVFL